MLNKSFQELYDTDVSEKTKKYNGFDYLPWNTLLLLLRELGAESVEYDETARHWTPDRYCSVQVYVEIDGRRRTWTHPVSSGDISIQSPNSWQISHAVQRAFVKCVAINWGLGLKLWEADRDVEVEDGTGDLITQAFGNLIGKKFRDANELLKNLGTTQKEFGKLIKEGDINEKKKMLNRLEQLMGDDF